MYTMGCDAEGHQARDHEQKTRDHEQERRCSIKYIIVTTEELETTYEVEAESEDVARVMVLHGNVPDINIDTSRLEITEVYEDRNPPE